MTWWGFLIFGVVLVGATALVTWLLVRRAVGAIDRNALAESERKRIAEGLAAETLRATALEAVAKELRGRLEGNRVWYEKKLEEIDADLDMEYDALARDDDALLDKLAALLGGSEDGGGGANEGGGAPGGEGDSPEEGGPGAGGGGADRAGDPPQPAPDARGPGDEGGGGGGAGEPGRGG